MYSTVYASVPLQLQHQLQQRHPQRIATPLWHRLHCPPPPPQGPFLSCGFAAHLESRSSASLKPRLSDAGDYNPPCPLQGRPEDMQTEQDFSTPSTSRGHTSSHSLHRHPVFRVPSLAILPRWGPYTESHVGRLRACLVDCSLRAAACTCAVLDYRTLTFISRVAADRAPRCCQYAL
jgi:hypothetical protein